MIPSQDAYLEAIAQVEQIRPDSAAVIHQHVLGLMHDLAESRAEQANQDFLLVDASGAPVATTSTTDINDAATDLADALLTGTNTSVDVVRILDSALERYGPVATAVFQAALRQLATDLGPMVAFVTKFAADDA